MIGLGLGGFAEQAVTLVSLAGVDQYVGGLSRMERGWNSVDDAQSRASRSGAMLQRIGFGLTAGITGSTLAFVAQTTKMGMASIELKNLVSQTFGSMTGDITSWSQKAQRELGLNARLMQKDAATMMQMFNGAGIERGMAQNLSKTLIDAKNDMVSFYADALQISDKEVQANLLSGLSGETEPLRKFGIFLTEETVKQHAYSKGIAAANSELSEQQKILSSASYIMERLQKNNVIGDLARTKDSPSNRLRRQQNEFQSALADFGEGALPIATDVLSMAEGVLPYLKQGVDYFKELDATSRKWLVGLALGIGPVTWGLGKIITIAQSLKGVAGIAGAAKGVLGGSNVGVMTVNAAVVNINGGLGGAGGALANRAGGALGTAYDLASAAGGKVPWWKMPLRGAGFGSIAATTVAGAAAGTAAGYGLYRAGQSVGLIDREQSFTDRMATGWGRTRDFFTGNSGHYDNMAKMEEGRTKRQADLAKRRKAVEDEANRQGWDAHQRKIKLLQNELAIEKHYLGQFDALPDSENTTAHIAGRIREIRQQIADAERDQAQARSDAFNAGFATLRGEREAYDRGENVPGFVTNSPRAGGAKRQDWDERTRAIASLFGFSQGGGGGGTGSVRRNRDGSDTVTLPVRDSDTFVRTLDRNNHYSTPLPA